jgi:hypothetical protein
MKKFFLIISLTTLSVFIASCGGSSDGGRDQVQEQTDPGDPVPPDIDPVPDPNDDITQVSGKITYDFVPVTENGLDYSNTSRKPVRKVPLEVVNAANDQIVGTTTTNSNGRYLLDLPRGVTQIYLIASAQIKKWDVVIEDNTNGDAKYEVASENFPVNGDLVIPDLNVPSGWNGSAYDPNFRAAAPFAILDTALMAFEKISASKPSLQMPGLKINWSVDNVEGGYFNPADKQIYLRGKENFDTDEFDAHVIVHEWGHYFENRVGRSDSVGGLHYFNSGERLDLTLAFGEGWGNALSAMVLDPLITYRDTQGTVQGSAFGWDLESAPDNNPGWYSEVSVQEIIFDLYDSRNDGGDTVSAGLGPIVEIMTTHQKSTRAKTSIFSFINGYKTKYPSAAEGLNTLTTSKFISPVKDDFGTGESNNGGLEISLPVYSNINVNGEVVGVSLYGYGARSNEMSNNRYYKFTAISNSTTFTYFSGDTFLIEVFDAGNIISYDIQTASDGNGLGPYVRNVSTQSGKVYTVRVSTEGDFVFNPDVFVDFQLLLE